MDYDVLPMTSPRRAPIRESKACRWENLTTYEIQTLMIVHGSGSEIDEWVNYMANFRLKDGVRIEGKPHVTDMIMALHSTSHNENMFVLKPPLPFFPYSHAARRVLFENIKRNDTEVFITEKLTTFLVRQRIKHRRLFSYFVDHES